MTPWTVAHQLPLPTDFSGKNPGSGLPIPPPGDFPYPGTEPRSPTLQADSIPAEPQGKPENAQSPTLKAVVRSFAWGPVVKAPSFQCKGYELDP